MLASLPTPSQLPFFPMQYDGSTGGGIDLTLMVHIMLLTISQRYLTSLTMMLKKNCLNQLQKIATIIIHL